MFGSYEQLQYIQNEIKKNNCSFIQMTWQTKTFQGAKMNRILALDLKEGVLMRARGAVAGMKPSWEFWYGFSTQDVLADDPSDGFDLPNYTTSFDKSKLSKKLNKVFKKFRQFVLELALSIVFWAFASNAQPESYSREEFQYKPYLSGELISFYTAVECKESEIDHVVSLKDAWDSGASEWDSKKRRDFANDRLNHVTACVSENRSKGSTTPMVFKKRSQDGRGIDYEIVNWCSYIGIYLAVKQKYELDISATVGMERSACASSIQ